MSYDQNLKTLFRIAYFWLKENTNSNLRPEANDDFSESSTEIK